MIWTIEYNGLVQGGEEHSVWRDVLICRFAQLERASTILSASVDRAALNDDAVFDVHKNTLSGVMDELECVTECRWSCSANCSWSGV